MNSHVSPSIGQLITVNAGLYVIRKVLSETIPTDFEWSFLFSEKEFIVGWAWRGPSGFQDNIRAETVEDLFRQVRAISWREERDRSRSQTLVGGVR